jgi:hypothetical protein
VSRPSRPLPRSLNRWCSERWISAPLTPFAARGADSGSNMLTTGCSCSARACFTRSIGSSWGAINFNTPRRRSTNWAACWGPGSRERIERRRPWDFGRSGRWERSLGSSASRRRRAPNSSSSATARTVPQLSHENWYKNWGGVRSIRDLHGEGRKPPQFCVQSEAAAASSDPHESEQCSQKREIVRNDANRCGPRQTA